MAERYAAVHASACLFATVVGIEGLLHFTEVAYAFVHWSVSSLFAMYSQKCFRISHIIYIV